jgi:hypothetical protein
MKTNPVNSTFRCFARLTAQCGLAQASPPRDDAQPATSDNLIAEKKAKPMMIAMEKGYTRKPGKPEVPLPPPSGTNAMPRDSSRMFSTLEEVFVSA